MFEKNKQKYILEFEIDFNLTNIAEWLKGDDDLNNVCKPNLKWFDYSFDNRKDPLVQSYVIDALPSSPGIDMFFHRGAGCITNNLGGFDYLGKLTGYKAEFCEKNKINKLSWGQWKNFITATVNERLVIAVPVEKFVELQINGKLSNQSFIGTGIVGDSGEILQIPTSFEGGVPNKTIPVWHSTKSDKSIGFRNDLCAVSAHTLNFEVEY